MTERQDRLWTGRFLATTFCGFLLFLNLQMLLSSIPAYLKEKFQAGDFKIGLATGLFAMSAVAARLFAGRPSLHRSKGEMLFFGLSAALLAVAGSYWCNSFPLFLLTRMIYGLGFGVSSTILPTMASNLIPLGRMGEGMGYFGFSNTLGLSLGPIFGISLLEKYGFGALAGAASVALLLIFPLIRRMLPPSNPPGGQAPQDRAAAKAGRYFTWKLLLPGLLNLLLSVTYSGLIGFIALFGTERNIRGAAGFFLVQSATVLVIRPFAGKLFDRKGPAAALSLGFFAIIAGLVLLSWSESLLHLLLSACVYGCGYGMIQPSIQAWMIKEVSAEERGMATGMFYNSIDLGVAVGSAFLGMVAAGVGYARMYRLSALFMVLFLLIFGLSWRSKRQVSKGG